MAGRFTRVDGGRQVAVQEARLVVRLEPWFAGECQGRVRKIAIERTSRGRERGPRQPADSRLERQDVARAVGRERNDVGGLHPVIAAVLLG
jgi:hypothetical protein